MLHRLSFEEAVSLTRDFTDLVKNMVLLEPSGLEHDIIQIAVQQKISVYDASYIALAKKHRLILVTEDQKLLRIASGFVKTIGFDGVT